MKPFHYFLICCCAFVACHTPKSVEDTKVHSKVGYQKDKNQILFLNLLIQQNAQTKPRVTLVQTTISTGKIKKDFPTTIDYRARQLLCSFLDINQQVVKQTALEHPLHKRYEYQNDEGQLTSKVVEATEGKFTLRTQLSEDIHSLKIEEVLDNKMLNLLEILNL